MASGVNRVGLGLIQQMAEASKEAYLPEGDVYCHHPSSLASWTHQRPRSFTAVQEGNKRVALYLLVSQSALDTKTEIISLVPICQSPFHLMQKSCINKNA